MNSVAAEYNYRTTTSSTTATRVLDASKRKQTKEIGYLYREAMVGSNENGTSAAPEERKVKKKKNIFLLKLKRKLDFRYKREKINWYFHGGDAFLTPIHNVFLFIHSFACSRNLISVVL